MQTSESQTEACPLLDPDHGRMIWRELRAEIATRGIDAPSLRRSISRFVVLLTLFVISLWFAWTGEHWMVHCVAYVSLAMLIAQFAFMGHDAAHGSLSRIAAVNRTLGHLNMTVIAGLAFEEWTQRHLAHHRDCQDERHDPDMAISVVASLTKRSALTKVGVGRWLTRYQWIHLWFLSFLFGHSQRHLSQVVVMKRPLRYWMDAILLLVHLMLWFGAPALLGGISLSDMLLAYFVPLTILGPYMAAIFWVNHVGMPLVSEPERFSFLERQAVTSRTILNARHWDWVFGGLNYQIEHHLFPGVSSARLREAQAIVREGLERNRVAYNGVSWRRAILSVARHFRSVANEA